MNISNNIYIKLVILIVLLILMLYYISLQTNYDGFKNLFNTIYSTKNKTGVAGISVPISAANISNPTMISTSTENLINVITTTTHRGTTIDPAELVEERPPHPSRINSKEVKGTLAIFLFQMQLHVLANLQLYLVRKFTMNLVAIEVFIDGPVTNEMRTVVESYNATLHSYANEQHTTRAGPSDKHTAVVNWAISKRAKQYLGNGTSILLLDGDVFPLSPFDAITLLNNRDLVCRKHPASWARYCLIGCICLSPHLYSTIHDFDISQVIRGNNRAYDSGGRTVEYLMKYPNTSFSWMKETIFLRTDKDLFWGAFDVDIEWILRSFSRCDKCGPEIFFSPFNTSDAVFYHMISATSGWRFGHQGPRQQALYDSVMRSPYGPGKQYVLADVLASVKKVQKMNTIPYHGNLTCARVCG